ncbi:MAG: DUF4249 domain-containing protein [Bacteroidetes bacterium CHB5]|nr:DUF4249 domain-containing protein [Bacteroidetes bacterium CHB5]
MVSRSKIKFVLLRLWLLLLVGCLDPYNPPVIIQNKNILVVEGFLNATSNSIRVTLSRTLPLYSQSANPAEKNAIVVLEEEGGSPQSLNEVEDGIYAMENLNLSNSKRYRLFIRTETSEYRSEYIHLKQSPPLDDVNWVATDDGVEISVSAHDPTNQTRYYQWKYLETWRYTADYLSAYIYKNDSVLYRNSDEFTYVCYKTEPSNNIIIKSTSLLSNDIVNGFVIHLIPKGSRKVASRYSILVQQRALDEDAYNYFTQLQKTTETVGGLFDPLPSQVTGNMYNVHDASEPVIGYFMGGGVQEKVIFINRTDLPFSLQQFDGEVSNCLIDTIASWEVPNHFPQQQLIEGYPENPNLEPYQHNFFLVVPQPCTDCRLKDSGTTTKPDFW